MRPIPGPLPGMGAITLVDKGSGRQPIVRVGMRTERWGWEVTEEGQLAPSKRNSKPDAQRAKPLPDLS